MHIYFSGIGGAGIGPLAQVANDAGYEVSGSDKQKSAYIDYLKRVGIEDVHIGQTKENIAKIHEIKPIDWFVYTSALTLEDPNAPELTFCRENNIKASKRDELLNQILADKQLDMIAVAGTHGKTTTTALLVYLFIKLGTPISYLLPAKTSFAEMGKFDKNSKYFIYEADEFDRNFLAFKPHLSLITGVSWDHHEIFVTREDYQDAFKEFIDQSKHTYIWAEDAQYLDLEANSDLSVLNTDDSEISKLTLAGFYNRLDAYLAANGVSSITGKPVGDLLEITNSFPGLSRRMEEIVPGLYSDYAHTPEKIRGAMSVAAETVAKKNKKGLIVIYEPLTDKRQHYIIDEYKDCFDGAEKLYWLPSYLAREDPGQRVIPPEELISHLANPSIATPIERSANLKELINGYLAKNYMVVGMAGGGGNSLDDWLRQEFK